MDDLIPLHAKDSQRCVAPWGEFLDDNTVYSGKSSEDHARSPFKDADIPLCQDILWEDYGKMQRRRQAQSLSASSDSSSSATPNLWYQSTRADIITRDDSLFVDSGNPWDAREYIKLGSAYVRLRMNPINGFWVRPTACREALERMAAGVDLEPQLSEDDEPETSFWSNFQASAASSPSKTATSSPGLSSIEEQNEGEESNNMLITLESLIQQEPLTDQDGILGRMEDIVSQAVAYENKQVAKRVQGNQVINQECTQAADLKKNDKEDYIEVSNLPEADAISNEQEHVTNEPKLVDVDQEKKTVDMMNGKAEESNAYDMQKQEQKSMVKQEQPQQQDAVCDKQQQKANVAYKSGGLSVRMKQYTPQLSTFKEPIEVVVKLSDMIRGPNQCKLQLADLVEPLPIPPAKHQARVTLADLL